MIANTSTSSYSLSLGHNLHWTLESGPQLKEWIESLAKILGLSEIRETSGAHCYFELDPDISAGTPTKNKNKNLTQAYHRKPITYWTDPKIENVVCRFQENEGNLIPFINMFRSLNPIFDRAVHHGGLKLHTAFAHLNNKGILIIASGDTGKTTCYNRLPPPWKGLCDDQVLVLKNSQDQYAAHPFPTWSEYMESENIKSIKNWEVQTSYPIAGLFFLEQSPADDLIKLNKAETCLRLFQSSKEIHKSIHEKESKEHKSLTTKMFENSGEIARAIPGYKLKASLQGKFWELIERVI